MKVMYVVVGVFMFKLEELMSKNVQEMGRRKLIKMRNIRFVIINSCTVQFTKDNWYEVYMNLWLDESILFYSY